MPANHRIRRRPARSRALAYGVGAAVFCWVAFSIGGAFRSTAASAVQAAAPPVPMAAPDGDDLTPPPGCPAAAEVLTDQMAGAAAQPGTAPRPGTQPTP